MGAVGWQVLIPIYWPDWILSQFDRTSVEIRSPSGVSEFHMYPFRVCSDGRRLNRLLEEMAPQVKDDLMVVAFGNKEKRMFLGRLPLPRKWDVGRITRGDEVLEIGKGFKVGGNFLRIPVTRLFETGLLLTGALDLFNRF